MLDVFFQSIFDRSKNLQEPQPTRPTTILTLTGRRRSTECYRASCEQQQIVKLFVHYIERNISYFILFFIFLKLYGILRERNR